MRATVTNLGTEHATVELSTESDGVNPPDVFSVTVALRPAPLGHPRRFFVEVLAGSSLDFEADEESGDKYGTTPETLLEIDWLVDAHPSNQLTANEGRE